MLFLSKGLPCTPFPCLSGLASQSKAYADLALTVHSTVEKLDVWGLEKGAEVIA